MLNSTDVKTCDDVYHWIFSLGPEYEVYAAKLKKHHVDGYKLLHEVNVEKLTRYGIRSTQHQHRILQSIEELKRNQDKIQQIKDKKFLSSVNRTRL